MVSADAESLGFRFGALAVLLVVTELCSFIPLVVQRFIKKEKLRDRLLSLGNSFSGGLFMGAGFVHLLAEANHTLEDEEEWYSDNPYAFILAPLGFFLAFSIEKVFFLSDPDYDSIHDALDRDDQYGCTEGEDGASKMGDSQPGASTEHSSVSLHDVEDDSHNSHDPHSHEHEEGGWISLLKRRILAKPYKGHHIHSTPHLPEVPPNGPQKERDHHHHAHHAIKEVTGTGVSVLLPYFLATILSIHSVVAGAALGIKEDYKGMLPLFIAMMGHKWIEAIALGISLTRANTSLRFYISVVTIYAFMVPLGIVIGTVLSLFLSGSVYALIEGMVTSFGAGTFFYVATIDILVEEFRTATDKYKKFVLVMIGYGMSLQPAGNFCV